MQNTHTIKTHFHTVALQLLSDTKINACEHKGLEFHNAWVND